MKYSKTEAGQQAFKARSELFSARQRSAFILFDGLKSNEQILAAVSGLGITLSDIDYLVQQGFLIAAPGSTAAAPAKPASASTTPPAPAAAPSAMSGRSPQERYRDAMPIATQLTASLGLRGFRLNLAVEGAADYFDLLTLLPKIEEAVGAKLAADLKQALKG